MLLNAGEQPKYGVLDWLVERGIYGSDFDDSQFLLDMQAASPFAQQRGLLHVVPALGSVADRHPENVLAKIARAYLELPQDDGGSLSFLGQVSELLKRLSALAAYDVILIDARAGLNETSAAALLGLGADILLFGIDTPQTFASYRYLLAHLARFPRCDDDDWLYRFHMVHAKAVRDAVQQAAFRDRSYEIFNEFLYRGTPLFDEHGNASLDLAGTKEFGLNDVNAPHYSWVILADSNYAQFDPLARVNQLYQEFYQTSYAGLIDGIEQLLNDEGIDNEE